MSITVILIIITVIISLIAFQNDQLRGKLIFYPVDIDQKNQYYRFITYGFLHADLMHLIFNMYAFYLFGEYTEKAFNVMFGSSGPIFFLLMYFLSLIACTIPDFLNHRHNQQYRSLGASGAVSAVVFAYILLNPLQGIGLLFIPVFIPGFIFGIIFLVVSYFLGRKGGSSVNHGAHIWGAIFGVVFLIACNYLFSTYPLLENFIYAVKNMTMEDLFQTY